MTATQESATIAAADSAVFHRRPGDPYPVFVRGEGCELFDRRGRRYLDLSSGMAWAASLGQGNREIAEVMGRQAATLTYIHNAWASTDRQEELAARLVALAPAGFARAMFTSGGSESNELALRIARQYHLARGESSRWKIVSLEHSYHGATIGALSMTGKVNVNEMITTDYAPYLIPFPKVPAPITFRGPWSGLEPEEAARRAAAAIEERFLAEGPETIAAFIAEPIMGNAGMTVPPDGYLRAAREVCDRHGVLFIADEVMTGAGRTGTFLRVQALGVVPDMVIMAKAISGGYAPLGAVLLHARVADALMAAHKRLDHVHTYSGQPVQCAVGLTVLDILERDGLVAQVAARGAFLRAHLADELAGCPWVGDIRGAGLADAVEYVADPVTRAAFPVEKNLAGQVWEGMLDRGYILPTGRYLGSDLIGDFSLLAPPFIISEAEIREAVAALKETLTAVAGAW